LLIKENNVFLNKHNYYPTFTYILKDIIHLNLKEMENKFNSSIVIGVAKLLSN